MQNEQSVQKSQRNDRVCGRVQRPGMQEAEKKRRKGAQGDGTV